LYGKGGNLAKSTCLFDAGAFIMTLMIPWYVKIPASIANGLILPLLFYRFRITPWSDPLIYWNVAVLCFGISYLVYYYRRSKEDRSALRTVLTNFIISFVALCVVGVVYFLIIKLLYALIGGSSGDN
jgi:hypothetical protein